MAQLWYSRGRKAYDTGWPTVGWRNTTEQPDTFIVRINQNELRLTRRETAALYQRLGEALEDQKGDS